jgi:hypothetical protein
MARGTRHDLQSLMGNSASIEFSNMVMQHSSFINVLTSITAKHQALEQAEQVVRSSFIMLEAHKQADLYNSFPKKPEDFSRVLAGVIFLMSEVNQENFVKPANINRKNPTNPMYTEIIEQFPLVAFAMIPYDHPMVFRRDNNPGHAVLDETFGCSYISRNYYLLNNAARQYVKLVLSIQCRGRLDEDFLSRQLHNQNFRKRLDEARQILCHDVLSSSNVQLAAQARQLLDFSETIRKSAVEALATAGSTPTHRGESHPNSRQGALPYAAIPPPSLPARASLPPSGCLPLPASLPPCPLPLFPLATCLPLRLLRWGGARSLFEQLAPVERLVCATRVMPGPQQAPARLTASRERLQQRQPPCDMAGRARSSCGGGACTARTARAPTFLAAPRGVKRRGAARWGGVHARHRLSSRAGLGRDGAHHPPACPI